MNRENTKNLKGGREQSKMAIGKAWDIIRKDLHPKILEYVYLYFPLHKNILK